MNLLLITADQWRGDSSSAVGHARARTPNVDRLAAAGALFTRHFGQATPCGPARASLYTGRYALNHRSITNGTPLDARHTHLARELRALAPADPRIRTYEGFAPEWDVVQPLLQDGAPWLAKLEEQGYGRLRRADVDGGALGEPAPFAVTRPRRRVFGQSPGTSFARGLPMWPLTARASRPPGGRTDARRVERCR